MLNITYCIGSLIRIKALYDFCKKQIEANLQGYDEKKWLEKANAEKVAGSYRLRLHAYAGLQNIDPINLPEIKAP